MTTAEWIARALGDDGMCFVAQDGRDFAELVEEAGAVREDSWAQEATRYLFRDGSALVEQGEAWDIEGSAPFSWAGAE